MGSLFGFFAGLGIISGAWSGDLEAWGFGAFLVFAIVGVLIFPRTIGTFMTAVMTLGAVAILAGLVSGNGDSAFVALGITLGAAATQFLIGRVRPESAY